jgi:ribosome-binding factor A
MSRAVFPQLLASTIISMSNRRIQRVSELVKQQISEVLLELSLPDCGLVTVTSAVVSPDLHEGRVYISVIGTTAQQQRALSALEKEHGRIQQELAHRIVLKYTPRLKFLLDDTESKAQRIETLLNELGPEPPE